LEIKDGDIWIDGKLARKPPLVQETLWQEQFPRAGPLGARKTVQQGWLQSGSAGEWKRLTDDEVRGRSGGKDAAATSLALTRRVDGRDVRLSFDVLAEDAAVVARITSRGVPAELTLPVGGDSLSPDFKVGERHEIGPMDAMRDEGVYHHIELTVLDGETWWSLDGEEQQRLDLPAGGRGATRVEVGVAGEATFRNLRVESDIDYKPGESRAAWDVPADGFFFLGDNVAGSDDSRRWTALVFHPPGGAPTVTAAASVPDEFGQPRDQIRIDGDMQRFVDVDGVPRAVPRAGTTVETIAYPFARRSHIVGRAVMIVFPWTVAEAGFRPRFLP